MGRPRRRSPALSWRLEVACPGCKQTSQVPCNFVGRSGLCPGCLDPLRIPDPGRPPDAVRAALAELAELPRQSESELAQARWALRARWVEPREGSAEAAREANCRACGEPIHADQRVCQHCGEYQRDDDRAEAREATGAPPWLRGAALLLDLATLAPGAICLLLALLSFEGGGQGDALVVYALLGTLLTLVPLWFQLRAFVRERVSLGKRWLGLAVIDLRGRRASLAQALFREALFWLPLTPLVAGLGFLIHPLSGLLLLIGQPQAIHDLVSNTAVVRVESLRPEEAERAEDAGGEA